MTFDEWRQTKEPAQQGLETWVVEDHFGYVPKDWVEVLTYDPGVIVELRDGKYFTHIDRSEYTGTLEEMEERLWDEYAQGEVG
jgi:hypothetical protein